MTITVMLPRVRMIAQVVVKRVIVMMMMAMMTMMTMMTRVAMGIAMIVNGGT